MPRVRQLSDEELEEIDADKERRDAVALIRRSFSGRGDGGAGVRERGRELADAYLRDIGLLPPV
jgi:hypothetical protein